MKAFAAILTLLFLLFAMGKPAPAAESATPREVVEKVKEAQNLLAGGSSGIEEFKRSQSRWVFKDAYVFIVDMDTVTVVAHPMNPRQVGRNMISLRDVKGNYFFLQFCRKAQEDGGGWVEYWWPRPGEQTPARKCTYVLPVPGTSLMVAAGVYDENATLEDLNKLVQK